MDTGLRQLTRSGTKILTGFVVLGAAVLTYIVFFAYFILDDEGNFLYQSWRILEGEMIYRDFPCAHMPLALLILAAVFKTFGVSAMVAKFLTLVCAIANIILVYLLGKELSDDWAGIAAAALFSLCPETIIHATNFFNEPYYLMFLLLGLLFHLKAIRLKKNLYFLLAGLWYGCAVQIRIIALFPIAGMTLFFAYDCMRGGFKHFKIMQNLMGFLWLIAGFSVVPGLISAYLALRGAPYFFVPLTLLEPFKIFSASEFMDTFSKFFNITRFAGVLMWIGFPVSFFYLIKNRPAGLLFFYLLALPLFLIVPKAPFYPRYFLFTVPALALLVAIGLAQLVRLVLKGLKGDAALVFLIFFFILFRLLVIEKIDFDAARKGFGRFTVAVKAQDAVIQLLYPARSVVQFLRTATRPEDYILTGMGTVAFLCGRKNLPLSINLGETTINLIPVRELEEKIEKFKPKAVVLEKYRKGHFAVYRDLPLLKDYLARDYTLMEVFLPQNEVYVPKIQTPFQTDKP